MKQRIKIEWRACLFLSLLLFLSGCKDDASDSGTGLPFDPSKSIEITGFNPETAGGGANFFIYGTNFGTDASMITVTVNGKEAIVISSDGTTIYCMVPNSCGTGQVKVKIGTEETGFQEAVAGKEFQYEGTLRVGTLIGWVDKDGNSTTLDGSFEKAQFREPAWLRFGETTDELYVVEQVGTVRKIDLAKREVTTLFANQGELSHPRSLAFSPDYDTLYISNDSEASRDVMGVAYALKKDGYKKWAKLVAGYKCNGADVHPIEGGLFYNSYEKGQLFKWIPGTQTGEELFRVGDVSWEYYVQFEPNGDYAYIVVRNNSYVLKSYYDWNKHTLVVPNVFVGTRQSHGYVDGVGTSAKFHGPNEGCFDKEGNFYLCDVDNHCIRKVTPDGLVSTFAGRPGESGYSDGDLRNQAQFVWPVGIVYDEAKGIFYVADCGNHRIRTIKAE